MTLRALLRDMERRSFEHKAGRIIYYPNLWRWLKGDPPEWAIERVQAGKAAIKINKDGDNEFYRPSHRFSGRWAELVHKNAVVCPNVELWSDDEKYPHWSGGKEVEDARIIGHWVSLSECRKCEHYCKTKDTRFKWPTCRWAREVRSGRRKPEQAAAEETLQTMDKAVKQVEAWLK